MPEQATEKIAPIDTGKEAAKATVRLIAATHQTLPPRLIVEKWVQLRGAAKKDRNQAMWDAFGAGTVECMARGSRYLARLWLDAWRVGHGQQKIGAGGANLKPSAIMKLYNDVKFVPSVRLDKYGAILK